MPRDNVVYTRLTAEQKRLRRLARNEGQKAVTAVHNMRHPVYEDDVELWSGLAVRYARSAWHYALHAEPSSPRWFKASS